MNNRNVNMNNGNSLNSGNTNNYMKAMGFNMNVNNVNTASLDDMNDMNDGTWYNYRVPLKEGRNINNTRRLRYKKHVPVKEYNLVEPEEKRGLFHQGLRNSTAKEWKKKRNTARQYKSEGRNLSRKRNNGSITPSQLNRLQRIERLFGLNNTNIQAKPKPNGNRHQKIAHEAAKIFAKHNTLKEMLENRNLNALYGKNGNYLMKNNVKKYLENRYNGLL